MEANFFTADISEGISEPPSTASEGVISAGLPVNAFIL